MEHLIREEVDESVKKRMLDFAQASFAERYPDVRDGLKAIHRRIIYGMNVLGLSSSGGYMKCAEVVGHVMGKYHPHGDTSIYGTLVAMAQPFTTNHPIVEGSGNFGNLLGDGAAAYRYTECRFQQYAKIFTDDLSAETVHFVPNYSNKCLEPTVLPTKVPNLLINGNYTIGAAAFNSSIPSHNLAEIIDLTIELMKNPNLSNERIGDKLLPDFPFGGIITNPEEIREFYQHGTPTSIKMISKYTIDEEKRTIIITELPYLVDGNTLKQEIIKKFPKLRDIGIESVDDDCDDTTMKLIITYLKTTNPHKLVEILEKKTHMKSSAQLILSCTIEGKLMENCRIKTLFTEWIKFRREIVRKVITLDVQKIYREMHITEALIRSYDQIDEIIQIIKTASSKDGIHQTLISKFKFTILQAQAIASMKLYDLSKMGKDALVAKHTDLKSRMDICRSKLNDKTIDTIIIGELKDIKAKFGKPRKTQIISLRETTARAEVPVELMVTKNVGNHASFIRKDKLVSRDQSGKVIAGSRSNEVKDILSYNTIDDVLLAVTNYGLIYKIDQIKSYLSQSTIESNKWESLTLQVSPRINETIVSLLSIPKSNLEDNVGDIVVLLEGNIIKKMNVSAIPTRIQANGSKFLPVPEGSTNHIQMCKYLDPKDGDLIAYSLSSGHVHVYPYSQIREVGKSAAGNSATISQLPITDIILCKQSDVIYMCQANGECRASKVSEIPQKRRNSMPYRLIGSVSGKRPQDMIVSLRKHIPNAAGILICGKDGTNCVGSDDPITYSVKSGQMVRIIPENASISQVTSVIEI